jgi:O-acetyl-ADP-ribose deacetylase (regulator of RNase III)
MKIIYKKGDLFQCPESVIIHGCNTQGVMGAGVAKLIKEIYPRAYQIYKKAVLERKRVPNARPILGEVIWAVCGDKVIGNAITQEFYGRDVTGRPYCDYDAVRSCMKQINDNVRPLEDRVAMPKIGAGLAGGDWDIIAQIIEEESTRFQPVVYEL